MSKSVLDVLDAEIAALTSTLRQLKSTRAALCRDLALLNRAAPNRKLRNAAKRAKALKPAPLPPAREPKPGDRMPDGTIIYVGVSPTKPGDRMPDGTIYVGVSPTTGRPLYAMPHDLRGLHTWAGAKTAAAEQTFGRHTDWRVPTKEELDMLYCARDAVGGFQRDFYWSSLEHSSSYAWRQYFNLGGQNVNIKTFTIRVRCVRSG